MADDIKATPAPREKKLTYVGPGSEGNPDTSTPTFSNLPRNLKNPGKETIPDVFHADELTLEQIQYIMETNAKAATWWVWK